MDEKADTLKKLLPFADISGFFFSSNLCMCFCPVFQMDLLPASKQFGHFLRNTKTCGAVRCLAERDRKQSKRSALTSLLFFTLKVTLEEKSKCLE